MNVQCGLCPKECVIKPGQSGNCRTRVNVDGKLRSVVYGYPCTMHVDPIEKKPFFHFMPSSRTFSLATVGCNLHCKNCQNWEISQANPQDSQAMYCPPEKLIELAKEQKCQSLSYTYTEPVVYFEYAYDTSKLARAAGLRNTLVTAGYINQGPWKKLLEYTDAARIDLKSMSDEFYRDNCSATLKPVLDSLVTAKASGVHLEVINLVIPTLNDKPEQIHELTRWVKANLGSETPLHFSQFYPQYKMRNLPPTSAETLDMARKIAMEDGLLHVYIGNIQSPEGQNTYCPGCKKMLVERSGFTVLKNRLKDGACPDCGKRIYGVWK